METEEITFNSKLEELHDLGRKAVDHGLKLGASQVETVVRNGFSRSIEIKNNSISGVQQQSTTGMIIRTFIGKKMGIASTTSLSPSSIEETVVSAFDLAKISPEDKNFISLAEPISRKPKQVDRLYDSQISNIDPEILVGFGSDMIQGSQEKDTRCVTGGQIRASTNERSIVNSLGISSEIKSTSMFGYSFVSIPVEMTNVGIGFEMFTSRMMDKDIVDYHKIGNVACEKAQSMLNAKVAETKNLPVLFYERATRQSLSSIIGSGVNGYSVMTNMSYFADKIAEQVAVGGLTAWDDPHQENGMGARIIDEEGIPTMKIMLVEDGVLKNYVTDSYTANKLGVENTGSASRSPMSKVPRPGISQVQIKEGQDGKNAMLEDMKEGILMETGVSPAGGSPNISTKINRGFYVKNGEIQYPLKNSMLGSNVHEFLKGIVGISKEMLFEFGYQTPSILVEDLSIGGAGKMKQRVADTIAPM